LSNIYRTISFGHELHRWYEVVGQDGQDLCQLGVIALSDF
jgi:hypothetical protein